MYVWQSTQFWKVFIERVHPVNSSWVVCVDIVI